ncbi:hypothetical protein ES708_29831 [subsurface metagenome]
MKNKRILILVLVLAFLFVGCQITPVIFDFFGLWLNVDSITDSITRVEIWRIGKTSVYITIRGKCEPVDCFWGVQKTNLDDTIDGSISLVWDHDFAIRNQELILLSNGQLKVVTFTHFVDGSGRTDYELTEYFTKE